MTWTELVATLLGIACVWLSVVRNVWTFPTAIGSVLLVGIVAFRARLYSDALLQAFFIAANAYGWWNWRRSRGLAGAVVVERMSARQRLAWAGGCVVAIIMWSWPMQRFTAASYPWWDGSIAIVSIVAQVLMGQRRLENWSLWIAVDLASIPLYVVKDLRPLAALYIVYLALAIWGWLDWRRAYRAARAFPA